MAHQSTGVFEVRLSGGVSKAVAIGPPGCTYSSSSSMSWGGSCKSLSTRRTTARPRKIVEPSISTTALI